jgi:hypothetical protein
MEKIYLSKDKKNIIIEIPLWQDEIDACDNVVGKVPNVIGVIAGDEMSISQGISLGYKGDFQEGASLYNYFGTKEEFKKLCQKLGIACWEHEICGFCHRPIYGSCVFKDGNNQCYNCEKEDDSPFQEVNDFKKLSSDKQLEKILVEADKKIWGDEYDKTNLPKAIEQFFKIRCEKKNYIKIYKELFLTSSSY